MQIKRNRFIFTSFLFVSLMICVIFSSIKAFSYVSLLLYIAYLIYLYCFDKTYFVKYLAFIFSAIATVAGVTIIELLPKQYLPEMACQSYFTGSLPLLIFSYWIFLYILESREYHYENNLKIDDSFFRSKQTKQIINLFALISCLLFLILFGYVATHTSPAFVLKVDRFIFSINYEMPWLITKIRDYSSFTLIFSLLSLIYGNRLIGAFSVLFYSAYNIWIGEKFGALFSLLCILLIVLYNKIVSLEPKVLKRALRYIIVIFLVLIVFAVSIYSIVNSASPYEYFTTRNAQQGQLWWKTYDLYNGQIHPTEFDNEINAFIEGDKPNQECIGAKNGIYKVMYLCVPEYLATAALSNGSRYTQADYAVMNYYFGIPGVIVYSVSMGFIISGIVNLFIRSLQKKEYIKAMIYMRFFTMIRTSFSMFTFGGFLSTLSILSYAYLFFSYIKSLRIKNKLKMNLQASRVITQNEQQ